MFVIAVAYLFDGCCYPQFILLELALKECLIIFLYKNYWTPTIVVEPVIHATDWFDDVIEFHSIFFIMKLLPVRQCLIGLL